jgi:tetratricopeptide (TPR) repeat protein
LARGPARHGARWIGAAVAIAVLAACSSVPRNEDSVHALALQLRQRGLDPAKIVIPFATTPQMREWVRREIPSNGDPVERLNLLLRTLSSSSGLQLEYESDTTITAAEAFAVHKANCLSYTNLFVGLARDLGIAAYFLEVDDIERFTREGDFVVVSGHVTAAFGAPQERQILDFTQGQQAERYRDVRQISDLRAVALYYSNRGAGELRARRYDAAVSWLSTSVALDPDLSGAWINLGVARRRTADYPGAETAYRRALVADPTALSAYQNLAALLHLRGRHDEANDLLKIQVTAKSRNPFLYLELGDVSLRQGRLPEAENYYRHALRVDRDAAEVHAALGLLAWQQGHRREASRWLRRAEQRDATAPRVARLRESLAH